MGNVKALSIVAMAGGLVLLSACSGGSSSGGDDEVIVIQLGYSLGAGTVTDESAKLFEQLVEEDLGDAVDVQLFPDGQLGADTSVLEGLQLGTHDATIVATPITTLEPDFGFFELPYLFESREDVESVTQGEVGQTLLDGLQEQGVKGLAYMNSGWRHVTTAGDPVLSVEDMEGLKIRTPSSPARVEIFERFGANPTPLDYGELFSALQQGVVDGQENPIYVVSSLRLNEVQSSLSLTKHVYTSNYLLLRSDLWDSFPEEVQSSLQSAADAVSDESWAIGERLDAEALEILEGEMEVVEPDLSGFREASRPMYDDSSLVDEELMTEILEAIGG